MTTINLNSHTLAHGSLTLKVCGKCGAVVFAKTKHRDWHADHEKSKAKDE